MAASGNLPIPLLDWSNPDRTESIRHFKRKCELWFQANGTAPEKQFNFILLWAGQEGIELSETWNLSNEDYKDPQKVWEKFEESEAKENFRIHRLEFQKIVQLKNETIDEYVKRLKLKVNKCKATNKDDRIIDQMIAGIKLPEAQNKLLRKDDKLTLDEAIDICKTQEASQVHMDKMKTLSLNNDKTSCEIDAMGKSTKGNNQPSSRFRQGQTEGNRNQTDCGNCGRIHPPRRCPAYRSTCSFCKKPGHWIEKCRSKNNTRYRRTDCNYVHELEEDNDSDDQVQMTFSPIQFQCDTIVNDEVFTDLELTGFYRNKDRNPTLRVKVDTGAQGNILPLRIFKTMFPQKIDGDGYPRKGTTRPNTCTLLAYNGSKINQYGTIELTCNSIPETFFVTDSPGPAIFGLPSSTKHKLVSIHCPINKNVRTTDIVSERQINDIEDLKQAYPDRFEGIGNFKGEIHIELNDNTKPVIQPNRKYPIQLVPEIVSEIEKMEKSGVIESVDEPTDWVNALAFSRKNSGGLRVCLDPKELNKSIKRTYHKTPTLEEITNKLSGAKLFSKLDAKHGYWSVKLDEASSKLTTFNSPRGRYKFKRLPFGLNISQDIFQKHMDDILEKCPGTIGITDDIVVFGKDDEEHDQNLRKLMQVARASGLVFNAEKCKIKKTEVKFFGMIFDQNGIRPDPAKTSAIRNLTAPKNVTELQQFLGMIQYLAPFIPNLSDTTEPLRALMKKGAVFEWSPSHDQAFERAKNSVCDTTSLAYFDTRKKTVIQVDSSLRGIGAVLMQDGKPVAFASKALTEAEQRYANIERELLAVVFGCERFHTYVFGSHFTVETDHKPLENIAQKSLANTPPRLQRLMLRLQRYDIEIRYKPCKEILLSDALSRLNPEKGPEIQIEQSIFAIQFSPNRIEQLRQETLRDDTLTMLKKTILEGWPDSPKGLRKEIRHYWSMKDELSIENDILLKGERVIIPDSMKAYILDNIHTGHLGIQKCQLRAKTCVYWQNINKDIENCVRKCITCAIHSRNQTAEPLHPHTVPDGPWQTLGTDVFTFEDMEYCLVVDYFSKMVFVRKMGPSTTSEKIIQALKQIFGEHGIPQKVVSDNARQYTSDSFQSFAHEWGFQHETSSPKYPQSNGLAERFVQTVKNTLKKARETRTDPDLALLIFRSTPIDSKLPSPTEILYSRKIKANLPFRTPPPHNTNKDISHNLKLRQNNQKKYFDKNSKHLQPLRNGQHILMQKYSGASWEPAIVTDKPKPRSYIIKTPNGRTYRRNRRQLMGIHPDIKWEQKRLDEDISECPDKPENNNDHVQSPARQTDQLDQQDDIPAEKYSDRPKRDIKRPTRLIESI